MLLPSWQRGHVISLPFLPQRRLCPRTSIHEIFLCSYFSCAFLLSFCTHFIVLLSVFSFLCVLLLFVCFFVLLACIFPSLQAFRSHFSLAHSRFLYLSRQRLLCTSPLICMHSCTLLVSSALRLFATSCTLSAHISFIAAFFIHCIARQQKIASQQNLR